MWNKAAIPLKEKKKGLDQLIHFYERWNLLKKTSLSLRQKPSKKIQTNIECFEKELGRLRDLSSHECMHHARFMRKAIYLLKMELMTERISVTVEERRQIHQMAQFIALFYAKYFLRSRIAVFTPQDDLQFLSSMISYRDEDPDLAIPVIASIKRHLWYLSEQLVVLALFNEELGSFIRSVMAQKIFSIPRPDVFKVGKPKYPTIDDNNLPLLSSLLGPRSWLIFSLLGLTNSQEWLQLPPKYWDLISDYRVARDFCFNLQVVNDCAERAIKLVEDFSCITKDEKKFQFLIQCVEDHRKNFSSFTQSSLLNL